MAASARSAGTLGLPDLRELGHFVPRASEIGLEASPAIIQAPSPLGGDATAKSLDLTQADCDALVAYVKGLGTPPDRVSNVPRDRVVLAEGRAMFESAGCATWHQPPAVMSRASKRSSSCTTWARV